MEVVANPNLFEITFVCDVCRQNFETEDKLKYHLSVHQSEHTCNICSKVFSDLIKLKLHLVCHGEKTFVCRVCNRGFRRKSDLKGHEFIHLKVKPFVCDICQKSYARKYDLRAHYFTHTGLMPFKCNKCDKSFSFKKNLVLHLSVHKESFTCSVCQACFPNISELKVHRLAHQHENKYAGLMPFKCNKCDRSFSLKHNLVQHLSIHKESFTCKVCQACFPNISEFKVHRLAHQDENKLFLNKKCIECGMAFATTKELNEHFQVHSKIFVCDVCYLYFPNPSMLESHARKHKDVLSKPEDEMLSIAVIKESKRQNLCSVCEACFETVDELERHSLVHCYPASLVNFADIIQIENME